ncbi:MAG: bifunctional N(6)-L-threonylcarbamoyladenine synthase/serine/threonine protein kinase [Candidatus Woesearchaeota archaeon]
MICLGIESTAHTFGASVVQNTTVLSNQKHALTNEDGGMIPALLAEHHVQYAKVIITQALKKAKMSIQDVNCIAISQSPGIGNALRIGMLCAKTLAVLHNKPLVGVNHCIAHLEIGRLLTQAKDPILLYASGANTQIISYEQQRYRILGETLDNGIGNMLDMFARHIGLGFPGGPKIAELAQKSTNYIPLPYVVKGMDVSFGGILTNIKQKYDSKQYDVHDICFSLQETVFAMLTEVTERALAHCNKNEVVLGGGVACNTRLQQMVTAMCAQRNATCYCLPNEYNVDNAAMIALTGLLMYKAQNTLSIAQAQIEPYVRTDDVIVNWR